MFKKPTKKIVPPYSVLADIYDFVMNHVNYQQWAKHVYRICQEHKVENPKILDISCGTGKLCFYLTKYDLQAAGLDMSPKMVKKAKERFKGPLWCGDMRCFSTRSTFNVVVSLYDSMNYLMTDKDWSECFKSVFKTLEPEGLFIFDVSTPHNSENVFHNYVCKEKNDAARYIRKSHYDEKEQIQTNEFRIRLRNRKNVIFYERHQQKIMALETIERMVANSSFEIVGKYSEFSFLPVSINSERVHYVLKK